MLDDGDGDDSGDGNCDSDDDADGGDDGHTASWQHSGLLWELRRSPEARARLSKLSCAMMEEEKRLLRAMLSCASIRCN